jgi:hypothetical protein
MPATLGMAIAAAALLGAAGRREAAAGRTAVAPRREAVHAPSVAVGTRRERPATESTVPVVAPTAPPTAAAADPAELVRDGQRALARKMTGALGLDEARRTQFIADYMAFIEGVLQADLRTQSRETVAALIRTRQAEFEARASLYLDAGQMSQLREMLRSW